MIFVDGLKFFYGIDGKVNINELAEENILKVNGYFVSMNYSVKLDVYPTMKEYVFKYPDYFKYQAKIQSDTLLEDFYYETFGENNIVFRISFKKL